VLQANQSEKCYLEGGVETSADGNVPPAFTCWIKSVLGYARYFPVVLWTARPVHWRVHYDGLTSLRYDVWWRCSLYTWLWHTTNHLLHCICQAVQTQPYKPTYLLL